MNRDIIPGKKLGSFDMLPAKEGTCEECAVDHPKEYPHNQQSLFYQYHFYNDTGRWPTWGDAMAHCSAEMQTSWKKSLIAHGVDVSQFEVSK